MKNQNNKNNQTGPAGIGVAMAIALGFCSAVYGVGVNTPAYATEVPNDIMVMATEDKESNVTAEEARQAAEELVNTIRRLERTPDYQKISKLAYVQRCMYDSNTEPTSIYNCTEKTNIEDFRAALIEVAPESRAEIEAIPAESLESNPYSYALKYIPWYDQLDNVVYRVGTIYQVLKYWSVAVVNRGITGDFTVDNIAKIMQITDDTEYLGNGVQLDGFWTNLAILRINSVAGKIARINSVIDRTKWMEIVRTVYDLELSPTSSYHNKYLSDLLVEYAGNTYSLPAQRKIEIAQNLSDYGQAKTLFDAFATTCHYWRTDDYGNQYLGYGCTIADIQSTPDLVTEYEKIYNSAELLYPDLMEGVFDYRLVLADLDNDQPVPAAPNTGSLGLEENTGTIVALSVAAAGILAAIGGGLAVARLYSPHRKNLFAKKR